MIRVLIIEDSPTVHQLLVHLMTSSGEIEVVGWAQNGQDGVRLAAKHRPDLITMDIRMPKMDGFEATRRIMEETPTPILVISSNVNDQELNITFNALKAGALEVVEKPRGAETKDLERLGRQLVDLVQILAGVKVVRRYSPRKPPASVPLQNLQTFSPQVQSEPAAQGARLVAVGASTGGPQALEYLFKHLPSDYPHPIVVVQHMTVGFLSGLVQWLDQVCPLPVSLIRSCEPVGKGIHFAPDGFHVIVDEKKRFLLETDKPVGGHIPSVDRLFESVAERYRNRAVGILLTGMGADGAKGMKTLYDAGALTIAQDETTSTVFGMPKEAIESRAARWILPLGLLPQAVANLPLGPLEILSRAPSAGDER